MLYAPWAVFPIYLLKFRSHSHHTFFFYALCLPSKSNCYPPLTCLSSSLRFCGSWTFFMRHLKVVCLREGSSVSSWQWFSSVSTVQCLANTAGLGAAKNTSVSTATDEKSQKHATKLQNSFWRVDFHFYWYTYGGEPPGVPDPLSSLILRCVSRRLQD